MFRKIVAAVIIVPLLVIIVGFAVANRQTVTVSFDPFSQTHPAYAATLPLFAVVFIVLIVGVIIGGAAAWISQSRWRRSARRLDAEIRQLRSEIEGWPRHLHDNEPAPTREEPLPVIAPPIP